MKAASVPEQPAKIDEKVVKEESSGDSDNSSFDSNSNSGANSVKKRLEKEKMKRIMALKQELMRRQQQKDH